MIQGVHAMFYTTDAEATRAFLRDQLRLTAHDVGEGWLIFDVPEADMGCHPAEKPGHEISFYCNDIELTVAELRERGVSIKTDIRDDGWGFTTSMEVPGVGPVTLYQPKYQKS